MKPGELKIIPTGDGSQTLYHRGVNDNYHSIHGAVQESRHVFINQGFIPAAKLGDNKIRVLEAGYGTGLNALLTFLEAGEMGIDLEYTGIDLYPLQPEMCSRLNYPEIIPGRDAATVYLAMTQAPWNSTIEIFHRMKLNKTEADLASYIPAKNSFEVVYFDAFAPDVQPELWQKAILGKFTDALLPGGVFVTYSAKGQVRRDLTACGLLVERVPGPPGKREMLRGIKV